MHHTVQYSSVEYLQVSGEVVTHSLVPGGSDSLAAGLYLRTVTSVVRRINWASYVLYSEATRKRLEAGRRVRREAATRRIQGWWRERRLECAGKTLGFNLVRKVLLNSQVKNFVLNSVVSPGATKILNFVRLVHK